MVFQALIFQYFVFLENVQIMCADFVQVVKQTLSVVAVHFAIRHLVVRYPDVLADFRSTYFNRSQFQLVGPILFLIS